MTPDCKSSAVADLVRRGQQLAKDELQEQVFDVHGVTTKVVTNSGAVARAVARLLRAFKTGASGQPDIQVHLFEVDSLSDEMGPVPTDAQMMYDWGIVKIWHKGQCRYLDVDNRARVLADVEKRTAVGFAGRDLLQSGWVISNLFFYPLWGQLIKESGLFPLHAAGLVKDGMSFLFLGRSGSGKSTLALHLVGKGYGLLSDDTVFLRMAKGGRVEALCFPEEINVNDQTIKLLPELSRVQNFTVNELRQKSSFSIEELYPGCVADRSSPAVMVFPQIADSDGTTVETVSRTEALALSMRFGFFFLDPSTTGRHFELLSRLVNQTDCYRLNSGRNQEELKQTVDALLARSLKQTAEEKE